MPHQGMPRVHLVLCLHGLGGTSRDFSCLAQSVENYFLAQVAALERLYSSKQHSHVELRVLSMKSNEKKLSHCGMEEMGQNMVKEIECWLEENGFGMQSPLYKQCSARFEASKHVGGHDFNSESPKQGKSIVLSVISHSLGGLIARYGVKEMFFGSKSRYFRTLISPGFFTTICTPHLGTRHPGGGKHIRMISKSIFRTGARFACKNFMGKTGMELYLKDAANIKETMLYRMSLPDSDFMKALRMFRYHTLIASTRHDHIVPYCSASVRSYNPHRKPPRSKPARCSVASYSGFGAHLDEFEKILSLLGHDEVVNEDLDHKMSKGTRHNPFCGKRQSSGWHRDNLRHSKFDATMLRNLQTINWRRLSFEYQLPSFLNHANAHSLSLGSWFTGSREDMAPAGISAVRVIMMLVYMDHRNLMTQLYDLPPMLDTNLDPQMDLRLFHGDSKKAKKLRKERLQSLDSLLVIPEHELERDDEDMLVLPDSSSSDVDDCSSCDSLDVHQNGEDEEFRQGMLVGTVL